MLKKIILPLILACVIITLLSCQSKINNDQLEVQKKFVHKLSSQIEKKFYQLINFGESADFSTSVLKQIKNSFDFLESVTVLDDALEPVRTYPQNYGSKNLFKSLPKNDVKKALFNKKETQIYFSPDYQNLRIFVFSSKEEQYLVLTINTLKYFKQFTSLYFPLPYNLLVIDGNNKIVFSPKHELLGSDFLDMAGEENINDFQHLESSLLQNDTSYSLIEYQEEKEYISELYCWETLYVHNKKFRIILNRVIPPKIKSKHEDVFLLSTLRSYAVKDTLIKSIMNGKYEEVGNIVSEIYQKNPEIYSIQFADSTGRIIFGKPKANSIVGYSYEDKIFLDFDVILRKVYNEGEMQILHNILPEGGEAKIIFTPIEFDNRIIGVLISTELRG